MKQSKDIWWFVENDKESVIINSPTRPKMFYDNGIWTCSSKGYDTQKELIEGKGILPEPCRETGRMVNTDYTNDVKKELIKRNVCYNALFWLEKIDIKNDKNVCRINGRHYQIGPKTNDSSSWKGFSGNKFKIKKFDSDEIIETDNLWHQGIIPDNFKDRLPNNAEFVK